MTSVRLATQSGIEAPNVIQRIIERSTGEDVDASVASA